MKSILIILSISFLSCTKDALVQHERINNIHEWTVAEAHVLKEIQVYRSRHKVKALIPNKDLRNEAAKRVYYIIDQGVVTHNGMSTAKNNLEAAGYSCVTELLAYRYSLKGVVSALIRSDAHNNALIDKRFTYVGVYTTTHENKSYYVILFCK